MASINQATQSIKFGENRATFITSIISVVHAEARIGCWGKETRNTLTDNLVQSLQKFPREGWKFTFQQDNDSKHSQDNPAVTLSGAAWTLNPIKHSTETEKLVQKGQKEAKTKFEWIIISSRYYGAVNVSDSLRQMRSCRISKRLHISHIHNYMCWTFLGELLFLAFHCAW